MDLEYYLASPLISITFFAIAAIVIDAFTKPGKPYVFYISLIGLFITGLLAAWLIKLPGEVLMWAKSSLPITNGKFLTYGGFANFFDILFCAAGILVLLASPKFLNRKYKELKEYYSLIMLSVGGMMLIAHAENLIILFIGIEIMSVSFYVLAGFNRNSILNIEASLKYFLLGAFATGFLLFGMAFLYGSTGSLEYYVISAKITGGIAVQLYYSLGIGLIIIGLGFKASAFPFHQWAPDVYQGSMPPISAFLSSAGKAAAFAGLMGIARFAIPMTSKDPATESIMLNAQTILAILAAATMLVGNLSALAQKSVKRMLAYSSVAHAGYLLMGIVAANQRGWSGLAFYSAAYIFMQIGAFIVVSVMEKNDSEELTFSDLAGLRKAHPALAAAMAIFMFSLAGLPPFAGFFGKYYLFTAAIEAGFVWLTIIAVISSIISVYFYIGLVLQMYFKEPEQELISHTGRAGISIAVSVIALLAFGIFPSLAFGILPSFIMNLF